MRRTHLLRLLAALAALGLLVAACGGDDDEDLGTGDGTEDVSGADDLDDVDDESEEAAERAAEDALGAAAGGECAFLGQLAGGFEDLGLEDAFLTGEPVDFGTIFQPFADELGEVADAAPDEIRDAFRTIADGFQTIAGEFDGVIVDPTDPESIDPETLERLDRLGEDLEGEFEDAADEIDAWLSENCSDLEGLDLEGILGG